MTRSSLLVATETGFDLDHFSDALPLVSTFSVQTKGQPLSSALHDINVLLVSSSESSSLSTSHFHPQVLRMDQPGSKLRKRPRIQLRQPLTQSTSFPHLRNKASAIQDFIKPSASQVAVSAVKWVQSISKTHNKRNKVTPPSPVPSNISEDVGDDTTLAELDDDDKDDVFLKVKLLVEEDYSVVAAEEPEEEIQGTTATPEIIQPVYYSPLFYPFGCIECVLGTPGDVPIHDNGGDAQVPAPITKSVKTTEDEVVVAHDGDW